MSTIEKLTNLGFTQTSMFDDDCDYEKALERGKDRFTYSLIYNEHSELVYIVEYANSTKFISEEDFLNNHNDCNTTSINDYLKLKEDIIFAGLSFNFGAI